MRKVFLVLSCLLALFFTSISYAQSWFNYNWQYRNAIQVNNTSEASALSEFTLKVALGKNNFDFARCSSSGADIRFTESDGVTLLNYFTETFRSPDTAVIWVKVPYLPADSVSTVFMYYGNNSAADAASGTDVFSFYDGFENFRSMNAVSPLVTPTYDGSGEVVHPDMIYFPEGWNGYNYWMVMTPFPRGNDDYENPSILVSQNGTDWSVPAGLSNPIVSIDTSEGYLDDPDILFVDGELIVYYNEVNKDGYSYIKRIVSSDGINWSKPVKTYMYPNYLISPAIIYEDTTYYMWYMSSEGCYANASYMDLFRSTDGVNWIHVGEVNIPFTDRVIWHFNVIKNAGKYKMLLNAYRADAPDCANTSLYYAESTDKINWTVTTKALLTPTCNGWDNTNIYRASFFADELNNLRIWYSARNINRKWGLGYTEGNLNDFLNTSMWDSRAGDNYTTSLNKHNGQNALRQAGCRILPKLSKFTSGAKSYSVWLYDDLSQASNLLSLLRITDNQNSSAGIGVWTGKSLSNYVWHTKGYVYTETSVTRTAGWHKLNIIVKENIVELYLDDKYIAATDELLEDNIAKFSLEGLTAGEALFDDCYVREYPAVEPLVTVLPAEGMLSVQVRAILEGPYDSSVGEMTTDLNPIIPATSPYAADARTVSSIPAGISDWVLLEFRTAYDSAPVKTSSCFIEKTGNIVNDDNTSSILRFNILPGNYYIVIRHRNHLAVMSANPVSLSSSSVLYDFSASDTTAYGTDVMKIMGDGKYAIPAGDCAADGVINGTDFNTFLNDYNSAASGYLNTDINMDTRITGTDFNYFNTNYFQAIISNVH